MSVVSTKVQIGQNATAANNFVWERDASGLLVLRRGTHDVVGAELVKINADGGVNTNAPVFSAECGGQTFVHNTMTKIRFGVENFDTHNCFNNTDATVSGIPAQSFKPPVAGYYQVNASFSLPNYTAGMMNVSIYKNDTLYKSGDSVPISNLGSTRITVSGLVYLDGVNDSISIYGFQSSGTSLVAHAATYTWVDAHLVRAA